MATKRQQLSSVHRSIRKKRARIICPGCGKNFNAWHFPRHRAVYMNDDTWTCKPVSSQIEEGHVSAESDNSSASSPNSDTGDSVQELSQDQFRRQFQKHIRHYLHETDFASEGSSHLSDDCDEIWSDESTEEGSDSTATTQPTGNSEADSNPYIIMIVWLSLFLVTLQSVFMLSDNALQEILYFLKAFFQVLSENVAASTALSMFFPGSVYMLWKTIGVKKDNFVKYVVCRKCCTLYKYEECFHVIEGVTVTKQCSHVAFKHHRQQSRRTPCGEKLLKTVILASGKQKLYPFKTYCYKPVHGTIKTFLKRSKFEDSCELWRERTVQPGILSDVYDGKIWQDLQRDFLCEPHHYALMLNLDWFQPFKHVSYSVGVLYAVVLNLPPEERFKMNNVMLIGVIPDMGKEPKTATFIQPLVEELIDSWRYGTATRTYKSRSKVVNVKLALVCVGCDIPATRKLCGFLGHGATLGCSKCLKEFPGMAGKKDYSGFCRNDWQVRTLEAHVKHLSEIQKCQTQTDRDELERKYGVRYSPLLELPYFNPIRMSTIDPMHNFFQGTAKKMVKIWIEKGLLDTHKLLEIQARVDRVAVPRNIGRIPRKIATSFGGFTADQWKNWTNIFSVYALKGCLGEMYLENWRKFVLASRLLCSKIITDNEIGTADRLLIEFCKGVQTLYGAESVTPTCIFIVTLKNVCKTMARYIHSGCSHLTGTMGI